MPTGTEEAQQSPQKQRRGARRAIWLAIGVAIAWLVISGVVGPLSGKLSEVQKNDNASFLPASAESTLVANELAGFQTNESFPILVVVTNPDDTVLTKDQLAEATTFAGELPNLEIEPGTTVGSLTDNAQIVPIPSQDGKAVLINVPLNADLATKDLPSGTTGLAGSVQVIRDAASQVTDLQINVTGPGGIFADLIKVFGAIDIQLLGATLLVVIAILIIVYRSPFIWVLPITAALLANTVAGAGVYALAKADIIVLNGQSQGILTVLVIGAATDYALLMIARYREELHHYDNHIDALRTALRGVIEPIIASGATVSIGLLCLLLSELNSNKSLGPVGAIGIVACLITLLTLLPALLAIPVVSLPLVAVITPILVWVALEVFGLEPSIAPFAAVGGALMLLAIIFSIVLGVVRSRPTYTGRFSKEKLPPGRWVFWPRIPRDDDVDERMSGVWSKVARGVGRRPRMTWIASAVVMLILAGFTLTLKADGITTTQAFVERTDSVIGQEQLAAHYPGGLGTPTIVLANAASADAVLAEVQKTDGVSAAAFFTGAPFSGPNAPALPPKIVNDRVQIQATLTPAADSPEAADVVQALRDRVGAIEGADAIVGGQTASQLDVDVASLHDRNLIIPVVLIVIFVILMILLRSIVAPVLLIATVLLSFFATLGVCAIFFNDVFKFAGADTSFPLFAFVFLVALGVDYNIFLMTRVREESIRIGTRPGILKGLTVTGGVITSAGIVLAATFLVLGVLPLVFLRELGFAVAIGVLLDTFIIRSTLVPALAYDIGPRIWWPSKLGKQVSPRQSADA